MVRQQILETYINPNIDTDTRSRQRLGCGGICHASEIARNSIDNGDACGAKPNRLLYGKVLLRSPPFPLRHDQALGLILMKCVVFL